MKDVESTRPDELCIAAMLPRADVRDRLVGADSIEALAEWSRLGTSSPRRAAQLLARRPDLNIVPIRGNVSTRLRKLEMGEADVTLLAAAGLDRLGQTGIGVPLDDLLPAPAQGAVGIEIVTGNKKLASLLKAIDDPATHVCVMAERAFLAGLGGNCRSPVAALAECVGDQIRLRAEILTPDGKEVEQFDTHFPADDREAPRELARQLLERSGPGLRVLFAGWQPHPDPAAAAGCGRDGEAGCGARAGGGGCAPVRSGSNGVARSRSRRLRRGRADQRQRRTAGGIRARSLPRLPCFAVGDATADAARSAGFRSIVAGDGDASSLAQLTARHGAGGCFTSMVGTASRSPTRSCK
jgi:hydroxymethylbilane synthase